MRNEELDFGDGFMSFFREREKDEKEEVWRVLQAMKKNDDDGFDFVERGNY